VLAAVAFRIVGEDSNLYLWIAIAIAFGLVATISHLIELKRKTQRMPKDTERDMTHIELIEYLCNETKAGCRATHGGPEIDMSELDTLIHQQAAYGKPRLFVWGQTAPHRPWTIIPQEEFIKRTSSPDDSGWSYGHGDADNARFGPY
jgi:hypothetical protein